MNVFVVKSVTKPTGWSLQWVGKRKPTWIIRSDGIWAWYKFRRDAIESDKHWNEEK